MSAGMTALPPEDLDQIMRFYNIPKPLAKMMFAVIGGQLYPKLPFLLYKGHQRGIQRVEIKREMEKDECVSTVSIYPLIDNKLLDKILQFPAEMRKEMWEYYSKPTVAVGRASKENLANQNMWKWMPEMADKRGLARALRNYNGIGQTAYEELPEAVLTREDLDPEDSIKLQPQASMIEAETILEEPVVPKPEQKPTTASAPAKATEVPAPAAPTAASPAPAAAATDQCPCRHPWKNHFAQRDKVGCTGCFAAKKPYVCPISVDAFTEMKQAMASAAK